MTLPIPAAHSAADAEGIQLPALEATLISEALKRDKLRNRLARYAMAAVGPVASSIAQFTLSLVMLRLLSPTAFGKFTFLLVTSQLSWGIWGALFCAPLPVFLTGCSDEERVAGEEAIIGTSLISSIASLAVFFVIAFFVGLHIIPSLCFAIYGAVALSRWFARAYAYTHDQQLRTLASDLVYSTTVLAALAAELLILRWDPQTACYAAMLLGALFGLLPFGSRYFRAQFAPVSRSLLSRYGHIWQRQSRWALLGVFTTEATANAHVYLITLLQGPTAFAPIAASALLMRPVNVAQSALVDFERPQMARQIGSANWANLRGSARLFRFALAAIWFVTIALGVLLFVTNPRLIFPVAYDLRTLFIAWLFWATVAALRLVQIPESTMLQAAGAFRPLAMASVWSSLVTVGLVLGLIAVTGALWSIIGIVVGATIFWWWTWTYAGQWLRQVERLENIGE